MSAIGSRAGRMGALVLAVLALPPAAAAEEDLSLSMTGTCPGTATIGVDGATPGGLVALVAGEDPGSTTVPSGPCAGLEVELDDPRRVAEKAADEAGSLALETELGEAVCGSLLQAVDRTSCAVSPLVAAPSAWPAPIPRTGQTAVYLPEDDGDLRLGVPWPEPRFVAGGDGTVTDALTDLVWLQDAECLGLVPWAQALLEARQLADGACGLSDGSAPGDWRLPNIRELLSLVDYGEVAPALPDGHPFIDVQNFEWYWSSTTDEATQDEGWRLIGFGGGISVDPKTDGRYFWAVRGSSLDSSAPIPRTGQVATYDAGDDGELQNGVAWPEPRFEVHGDGTVTDLLTGLVWMRWFGCFGQMTWEDAMAVVGELGDGSCSLTDGSSPGDWRIPNLRELHSLVDLGQASPALPPDHPFLNVAPDTYWTSTSKEVEPPGFAWRVLFTDGSLHDFDKQLTDFVVAVRGPR